MLDFRHDTFCALCRYGNYAKTADALHITQPAVSQHIKYLEDLYGLPLIAEKGKSFALTSQGKELLQFIQSCSNGLDALKERIKECPTPKQIKIGATRSVGENILPDIISNILENNNNYEFHLILENTHKLLEKMQDGSIDFALVEGYFDTSYYQSIPFSNEEFIGVCSAKNPLAKRTISFSDLLDHRQILREEGSGSREIFIEILHENHIQLNMFPHRIEVNNLSAIKKLVKNNSGIGFLYQFCVKDELEDGSLVKLNIQDFLALRRIHFIHPKNSLTGLDYNFWFNMLKSVY